MVAGLGAYRQILADPRARAFSAAGLVARLPLSMTGLGIVLLISLTSGSFGRAGLVAAVAHAHRCGRRAAVGPGDRPIGPGPGAGPRGDDQQRQPGPAGHQRPARLAARRHPARRARASGVGFSSAGSAVRARWSHRLRESPLLQTAFALEAVLDEVVFIVGPVLVTFLATAVHPALGVSVSAVIGLVGAVLLAAQRSTQPPIAPRDRTRRPRPAAAAGCCCRSAWPAWPSGAVFGGMEVVGRGLRQGDRRAALRRAVHHGVVLRLAARRRGRPAPSPGGPPPPTRFRIGAAALAASLLPLPFLDSPLPVGGLLLVSGMAIAPTLIASVAVIESSVPTSPADRGPQLEHHRDGHRTGGRRGRHRSADRPGRGARRVLRGGRGRGAAGRLASLTVRARPAAQPRAAR